MKLIKHEHSFFEIHDAGSTLVIDPGKFTPLLPELDEVAAVVVTHLHDDHCFPPHLQSLRKTFPNVPIYAPDDAVATLAAAGITADEARPDDEVEAGPFRIAFHGGLHAIIHPSIPRIHNLGVRVNDTLYYPGDSFTVPQTQVSALAVPSSAPWLKVAEVIDFVAAVAPRVSFPAHDALWSEAGAELANARIRETTERAGGRFYPLRPGDALDL